MRRLVPLVLLGLLAACARSPGTTAWDGRRGYDGRGDYGYDPAASRAEARGYRARAARTYRVPGPPEDPWGPYVRAAAQRAGVPERWIREVMRQESGGRLYDASGMPITSPTGAMGLMQVMPATWDVLRGRLGLGADPYEPRDNILAGAAYIRAMYDRYGAPGFLAAYNAGPDRVDLFLAGSTVLPDETMTYVARIAPRLGGGIDATGPFAEVAAAGGRASSAADLAYAGGGMSGRDYYGGVRAVAVSDDPSMRAYAAPDDPSLRAYAAPDDPSMRAYDGGGLVTPDAPTGRLGAR